MHGKQGKRLYIAGFRVHHGLAGCALAAGALATKNFPLFVVGVGLVVHDLRDFPWPVRDRWA